MHRSLRRTFGLDRLRPGQREVIEAVLDGRDTLAIMPTGAGKSLCYQVPALARAGTALVISPLVAAPRPNTLIGDGSHRARYSSIPDISSSTATITRSIP